MRVYLDKIGPDGFDLDKPVANQWVNDALGAGSPFCCNIDGKLTVHLTRLEEVVHVQGRIALELTATCSRCLGPAPLALNTPFSVSMFPKGREPPPGSDGEISEDDMGVATYEAKEIELSGILHDEVFLQLPMNPICSEDCAGLCPNCGKNLNEAVCDCMPQIAPRWDSLRRIKPD